MKKLFAVRNAAGEIQGGRFFGNKQDAKSYRDELGGAPEYAVTLGPDHWRHEGERTEREDRFEREVS